jgi:hypothetical protein
MKVLEQTLAASLDWSEDREQKRRNDNEVIEAIIRRLKLGSTRVDDGKPITGITLPADLAAWEQRFAAELQKYSYTTEITAIERDPEVLERLRENAENLDTPGLTLKVPDTANNVCQTLEAGTQEPVDFVYLDYMGTWGEDKKQDLGLLFTRGFLKPGSVIALTFSLRRGTGDALQGLKKLAPNYPVRHLCIQAPGYNMLAGYRPAPKPNLKDGSRPPSPVTKAMRIHGIPHAVVNLAKEYGAGVSERLDIDVMEYSNDADEHQGPMGVFVFTVNSMPGVNPLKGF